MPDIANSPITELVRRTRPLQPFDSVTRAISSMRSHGGSAALVVSDYEVVGMVREADILSLVAASSNGNGYEQQTLPTISSIVRPAPTYVPEGSTIQEATGQFTATGADVLPVVGQSGMYVGYLLRSDLTAAVTSAIRPPTVGGLATPLGVHLTCGSQRGGVGDFALMLTGAMFGLLGVLGGALYWLLAWAVQRWSGQPVYSALLSPPIGVPNPYDAPLYLQAFVQALAVLVGIRLSRVAGYHAAEHQTVHAIEQGEGLDYESVRRMPRVHPRCGTNLMVAASIFTLLLMLFPSPAVVFVAIIIVLVGWRTIGGWMQQYITTRPATKEQIASGIKAGEELLRNYRDEVIGIRPISNRFWNVGFPQVLLGLMAVMLASQALGMAIERIWHIRLLFLMG
ncbi:MAG: DUF1385 domain-containing protein [Armatimonadetes bacterium]|nr:DUF1385 domain-containing protein [Armatimonadota bacterium]